MLRERYHIVRALGLSRPAGKSSWLRLRLFVSHAACHLRHPAINGMENRSSVCAGRSCPQSSGDRGIQASSGGFKTASAGRELQRFSRQCRHAPDSGRLGRASQISALNQRLRQTESAHNQREADISGYIEDGPSPSGCRAGIFRHLLTIADNALPVERRLPDAAGGGGTRLRWSGVPLQAVAWPAGVRVLWQTYETQSPGPL